MTRTEAATTPTRTESSFGLLCCLTAAPDCRGPRSTSDFEMALKQPDCFEPKTTKEFSMHRGIHIKPGLGASGHLIFAKIPNELVAIRT
jgi:hypothetical protein